MSIIPTPAQAMEWVRRYNQEEFHLHHAKTVGWVLGCLAQSHDPGQEEYWQAVGILHDIDFERWPEEHCKKAPALLEELGADPTVHPRGGQPRLGPLLRCGAGAFDGEVPLRRGRAHRAHRRGSPHAAHGL